MFRTITIVILVNLMLAMCRQARPLALQLHETSAAVADSATGAIDGVVVDGECGGPVGYANIWVRGTKLGAMSDSLGRFSITPVPTGTHRWVRFISGNEIEVLGAAQTRQGV